MKIGSHASKHGGKTVEISKTLSFLNINHVKKTSCNNEKKKK